MKRTLLLSAVLVLAVLLAYLPAFEAGFIWDDDDYVTENPFLTQPNAWKRIWFSLETPSQYFPMIYTLFRLEYSLWGLKPFGYHLVNVLLHAANALLIWWLLRRLSVPGAWLAAGLFALHPVNVESVAWVTELKNVLSTIFCLGAAHAWVSFVDTAGGRRAWAYATTVIMFALALFSKTTTVVLPVGLLVICWLREGRVGWRRLLHLAVFGALGAAMSVVTIWWEHNRGGTTGGEFDFTLPERLLIASRAFWFSLGKMLWPVGLAFSYPKWAIDPANPLDYVPAAALAMVTWALWRWRGSIGRGALGGLAFYTAALTPTLGFISYYTQRYSYAADHYQYLGSISLLAVIAAAVTILVGPGSRRAGTLLLVLPLLGALTWKQTLIYRDQETLWQDTLARNPGSWMARSNLGLLRFERGRPAEAVPLFREAISIDPGQADTHNNLGNALTALGEFEEAEVEYRQAVRLDPADYRASYNLALLLARQGRVLESEGYYRTSIRLKPQVPLVRKNYALLLLQLGRDEEALATLREALRMRPNYDQAHFYVATILERRGDWEGALRHYREALRLAPSSDAARRGVERARRGAAPQGG